jgi:putative flippase GtrA
VAAGSLDQALSRSSTAVVSEQAGPRSRAHRALRARHNWYQLAKFCTVGGSGYIVNLGVYTLLLDHANLHYRIAATGSFLVAASWNYWWNRHWTFRGQRGHFGYQGLRFFTVSALVYLANLGLLSLLVWLGMGKIVAQATAIILVTPLNFLGNKLWSFRR